jgi:hypothetical protein
MNAVVAMFNVRALADGKPVMDVGLMVTVNKAARLMRIRGETDFQFRDTLSEIVIARFASLIIGLIL